jgi:hypothetical protein
MNRSQKKLVGAAFVWDFQYADRLIGGKFICQDRSISR